MAIHNKVRLFRALYLIPVLMLGFVGLTWFIFPQSTAADFGIQNFNEISLLGQNALIRDFTAFFFSTSMFFLLGIVTLRAQWFMAAAIVFFFAGLFNLLAVLLHDTPMNTSILSEIVLFFVAYIGAYLTKYHLTRTVVKGAD